MSLSHLKPFSPLWFCLPLTQTLQMGIKHFSGLFVMLCVGVALSLLTTIAEHIVYKLVIPRVKEPHSHYWLHTSQVSTNTKDITLWVSTSLFQSWADFVTGRRGVFKGMSTSSFGSNDLYSGIKDYEQSLELFIKRETNLSNGWLLLPLLNLDVLLASFKLGK